MVTMNLKFEVYLQKIWDLQTRATKMDKTTLLGFFVANLSDAYQLQIHNNKATIEDAIHYSFMMIQCRL